MWNHGEEFESSLLGLSGAFPPVLGMLLGPSMQCQIAITEVEDRGGISVKHLFLAEFSLWPAASVPESAFSFHFCNWIEMFWGCSSGSSQISHHWMHFGRHLFLLLGAQEGLGWET